MSKLQNNITTLQNILEQINVLPEAGISPIISFDTSTGLITAVAGTKSSTHQLPFRSANTIIPSATSQFAIGSGCYAGGDIIVAGDANLIADNIKNGISIFGVNGTFEGGVPNMEDDYVMRTFGNSYTNDRVTSIGDRAFERCSKLTTVNFPAATVIGSSAFNECSKLTTISFPAATEIRPDAFRYCSSLTTASFSKVTRIGMSAFLRCSSLTTASFPAATSLAWGAFESCYKLKTIYFPKVTYIGDSAFAYCKSLTSASFPAATEIDSYAFRSCTSLTTASFPKVTSIGVSAFHNCSKLTRISFPAATYISTYAFASCSSLTTASFPKVTSIASYAFQSCASLTTASFPAATQISNYAFRYCYYLKSLYLTGSSVCRLVNKYAFANTPIGGYTDYTGTQGSIYVPASLLASYRAASEWDFFSSRIVGI